MNKKRLLALPVVCVVVAMIGASVMAAGSAAKNFKVEDEAGNDITKNYSYDDYRSTYSDDEVAEIVKSMTEDDELVSKVAAVNDKANVADADLVIMYDINEDVVTAGKKTVTFTGLSSNAGDVFVIVHFSYTTGQAEYVVSDSPVITVSDWSPFAVFRIAVTSSAQTGEYATPYIVVLAGALVACGAVCVVRAKKATR